MKKIYILSTETGWINNNSLKSQDNLDTNCFYTEDLDYANEVALSCNSINPNYCQVGECYLVGNEFVFQID